MRVMSRSGLGLGLMLALSACGQVESLPKTPEQGLLEVRAGLGIAVAGFNVYAGQRPFCDQLGAKPPPLCADRHIVIEGDAKAQEVSKAIDTAEVVVRASGNADTKWQALVTPANLLKTFQSFVDKVKGTQP